VDAVLFGQRLASKAESGAWGACVVRVGKAEALFEQRLASDRCWGWGWIGWADLHFFTNNRPKDYSRAGELLHCGYSTPRVRSREDIADRLVLLYRETGRDEEAEALAAEAKRISRSNSGVSVRRTIHLEDAGDRAVVRDTATATFEGERFPLERMTEIVEALDAARPAIRPRRATKGRTQRSVSVRERPEVQEVLRRWL
jgi:hypothetical protein